MIVKVCGVRTAAIAEAAVSAGADWIGIVFEPRSPRYADDATARTVVDAAGRDVDLIGVFVEPSVAECEEAAARYRLAAVQVHGDITRDLVEACPVPVIRGINLSSRADMFQVQWWPDCLVLLDGAPDDAGLPGGTGRRVAMDVAAEISRHRPIVLAGGLGPDTVADAIWETAPYGVDASGGLERTRGEKDAGLVESYVHAARAAFARLAEYGRRT